MNSEKVQQCTNCKYRMKDNSSHCEKYIDQIKPEFVRLANKECINFEHKEPLNIKFENQFEERVYGAILGFCIGDALGVPVEFTSRKERKTDPVSEMRAYGTHEQGFGTWSDDTSLLLCLMDSINKGYSLKNLSENFMDFYPKGLFTPNGELFDIGISTRNAIERMICGIVPEKCGGDTEWDNGNGSLMRVLPLAYYTKKFDFEKRKKIIEQVSSLTHSHARSKLACIFYIEILIELINGKTKMNAYHQAINIIKRECFNEYETEFMHFERILDGKIGEVYETEIKSTGYVVDTLEASIWSFLNEETYREVVLRAINLGDDTDTVAAIAGGFAGVYYGLESIPTNWKNCLVANRKICKMIEIFVKMIDEN